MQCRCKKNLFYIVIASLLLATTTACIVNKNQYPPVGYWYSEEPYLSLNISEEKLHAYHGTYKLDDEVKESVVFANAIAGNLEIHDASTYDFSTGEYITSMDNPLYSGTYKLKNGKLYFKLYVRHDGIEKLETIIMENIAED